MNKHFLITYECQFPSGRKKTANAVTNLSPTEWLLREETYVVPEGELSTTTVLLFVLEVNEEEYKRLTLILGGSA